MRISNRLSEAAGTAVRLRMEHVKDQHGRSHKVCRTNEAFERFYGGQPFKANATLERQSKMFDAMRSDLPQSFRLNRNRSKEINMISRSPEFVSLITRCRQLTGWTNIADAYQLRSESRWRLDENDKRLLVTLSELGLISRQELVSMVPVALLNINSSDAVLDMCSAPGSKTCQAIEAMHLDAHPSPPTGYVVANEVNVNRLPRLAKTTKRLRSPNVVIVHNDGRVLPKIGSGFDKIICDVPCSGDGTIRKNPHIWTDWRPHFALDRHRLQYGLVKRGLRILRQGGKFAYSSCSINPIEGEAVLARLLSNVRPLGALKIVDCSNRVDLNLPGLGYEPGLNAWSVMALARDNKMYRNWTEYRDDPNRDPRRKPLPETIFADYYAARDSPARDVAGQLRHCMRILPHHNNCGGFFVAIVEKIEEIECFDDDEDGHFDCGVESVSSQARNFSLFAKNRPDRKFAEDCLQSGTCSGQDITLLQPERKCGEPKQLYHCSDKVADLAISRAIGNIVHVGSPALTRDVRCPAESAGYRLRYASSLWPANASRGAGTERWIEMTGKDVQHIVNCIQMERRTILIADFQSNDLIDFRKSFKGFEGYVALAFDKVSLMVALLKRDSLLFHHLTPPQLDYLKLLMSAHDLEKDKTL